MFALSSSRLAAAGAAIGGVAFAVAGALQATGLDWTENAVETPLQHLTMALFAVGLVAVIPSVAALARLATGRGRYGVSDETGLAAWPAVRVVLPRSASFQNVTQRPRVSRGEDLAACSLFTFPVPTLVSLPRS